MRVPGQDTLLVSTPFNPSQHARRNMTVWKSMDSGKTWALLTTVNVRGESEGAAYSAMAPLNSTHIGLVYERHGADFLTWKFVKIG